MSWRSQVGGIEVLLPQIARGADYQFSAYVLRKNPAVEVSVYDATDIPVTYGPSGKLKSLFAFFRFCSKNKEHIFHGFNIGPLVLFILRITGVERIIYSIHGTIYWKTSLERFLLGLIWSLAINDRVHFTANSHWSRKSFLDQISEKPDIQVVYNPINIDGSSLRPKQKSYAEKIIYVGRLATGKNLHRWLECAKYISNHYPQASFTIYGEGPLQNELEDYAATLGISERIVFHGFTKDTETAYQEADLLLFLSEYESFGNVVVESILCGTPVIASRIPSMEEIFRNFPQFLVELDDRLHDSVLAKLVEYPELTRLALKARQEFQERFSLEKHIRELNSIYQNVLR